MDETIGYLTDMFALAFVVSSMFGLGLGLTLKELLGPLRNLRLVLVALLANFVIVPALAFALTRLLPLELDLQIGILLMATAAGAPLTLKAAQIARGDIVFSASLVTLQVVATVIYLPLVLPLLIPGVAVNTVAIALPLMMQVLAPLALGMVMNARYDEEAEMARPIMNEISNISLAILVILNLSNIGNVLQLLGTGAILAILLVIVTGFASAYFLSGFAADKTRRTLALGTAQRNYAAAFVIATGNFGERVDVIVLLITASLISMVAVLLTAGELRRRAVESGEVDTVAAK